MKQIVVVAILAALLGPHAVAQPAPQQPDIDPRNAVPASQAGKLPKSEERYRSLQKQIQQAKPSVESAKQKSEILASQASKLKQQLIGTAARVQALEREKAQIDTEILRLRMQEKSMSEQFARDRVRVSHLLAVLERLQSDHPPAVALEPSDALRSARGTMVLGASLPQVYGQAAGLVKQLHALQQTRAALLARRVESARNAARLSAAQAQLDQLLATKQQEASGASAAYQALQSRFDAIAREAFDLKSLIDRVAALRTRAEQRGMVVVSAQRRGGFTLKPGSLAQPVVGPALPNSPGERAPGMSFLAAGGAAVIAPADSRVLFAGPYHIAGQVLILETPGGYDLVLAGLARIDVRPGDQLLAGEPVGRMPRGRNGAKLYFELRRNGKGVNPAPWLGIDLRKAKKT